MPKKTPSFPEVVKDESVTVTIYEREKIKQNKDGPKAYLEYILLYWQGGVRKRESTSDYEWLKTIRVPEVIKDLKEGRTVEQSPLPASVRDDMFELSEALKPTGLSLRTAVSRVVESCNILGGDLMIESAREYKARHIDRVSPKLVSEAVKDFIEEKERGELSKAYTDRLGIHLNRFASAAVKNLSSVTADDIDLFLDNLKDGGKRVSNRTRHNYSGSIATLFRWAKLKRYVASDFDETDRITRLHKDRDGEIEIYTPEEMAALLARADKRLIPFLAIGAFAGLRSSEIVGVAGSEDSTGLDWSDVKLDNGSACIVVRKGKVKKRGKSRRIVPVTDNLKAWLRHAGVKRSGPVWPESIPYLYEMLRELAPKAEAHLKEGSPKAKLDWRSNALRHSFISYRVAAIKDVAQVSLEAGNSPQIIFSNYRELVEEPAAARYFAIMPPSK